MPKVLEANEKAEIVRRLFLVFRDCGYEVSTIANLSEPTKPGKSSLHHHFPTGKEQMAEAVLAQGKALLQNAVVDVAKSTEPLKARIRKIVATLVQLYASGRNPCLLGRLTLSDLTRPAAN